MWTGDMNSGYPTQWALNPSAYRDVSNEEVDWASLAQQWIKMKETFPAEQVPPAPPPPPIRSEEVPDIEGGEAPMDMSKDDAAPTGADSVGWNSWNNWQQWGWNWSGAGPAPSAPPVPAVPSKVPPITPAPPFNYTQTNSVPSFSSDSVGSFDYNHGSTVSDHFNQQRYWNDPAPFIRGNKNSEWKNDKVGARNKSGKSDEEEDTTTVIDAAKRKQLPAWIREGLEKMEREKQKKIEKERMLKEREELSKRKIEDVPQLSISGIPPKSKFDSDSETSEKESEDLQLKLRQSRFQDPKSPPLKQLQMHVQSLSPQRPKSKEQIMQEVMLKVRTILTEILMSVTNDEMHLVVDETLANYRAKGTKCLSKGRNWVLFHFVHVPEHFVYTHNSFDLYKQLIKFFKIYFQGFVDQL
uniref:Uncharacterized protein n=1 Tax=Clastoptera arizonana TaxID=38151 RepID=A0A1B6C1L6_9HEMI